ncbi:MULTISPECIES: hypothetical protein [Lysobacter]|uniref:Uncharacterized protein n=1 Tax=Lysobacter gummosus TaxID=262324 RepID=A0ABY3XIA8_9GAMM|nr:MULTISPECIES: hypothetical protein [Lysobacter]ALN90907.1 hypothetical protein LG3211_1937 [Lysobacter gummosus]MBT2746551.1 hypothetical protein [Lysobacter sp. ISL-42]MBT2754004.1 hypothetical protein [Lysobacter sp. ISL-50]MBT2778922.1 hypothetical protein [Lysobacter sp. ISL-54]MBT2782501.1 hypothetical protein [Lysobacter sp. ISL-52]
MSISPELQAKIDALEDERLKADILDVLTGPGKRRATDEAIYEMIVSSYTESKEEWSRRRQWKDDEVAAFAQYFKEKKPADFVEFIRQEKEFNEIESVLAWNVRRLIWELMPDLDQSDCTGLFGKFRDYVKLHLI